MSNADWTRVDDAWTRIGPVATGELVETRDCEYAAVSYCWSSVTSDEDLLAKVRMAVQATPIRYVWVDRFCLSSDARTRQEEVHHMADIYANARLVLILPGTQITELDNMRYDANGTAIQLNERNIQRIGEQWTQAGWRSRCWTFQEASTARATAVVTGSRKRPVVSGAALDALATSKGGSVKLVPWHPLDDTWMRADVHTYEAEADNKYHLFRRSHRVCGAYGLPRDRSPEKQQLLVLMGLSWNRKASKELDTVYSLLSMAYDGHKVPVRYDITMEELYRSLIENRVVGAEIMALGGGYVGPTTCWMPSRENQRHYHGGAQALHTVHAGITDKGTLRAAVVPVSILSDELGGFDLRLAGVKQRLEIGPHLPLVDGWQHWQAHVLAPLTSLNYPSWRLVLVFSSGTGSCRHVEEIQVLEGIMMKKKGMESLVIETVEYGFSLQVVETHAVEM